MKKLFLLFAVTAGLVSCDDTEPMENSPFFYLTEGNMWVYKRYASDDNGQNLQFTGQNDTVRIAGPEVIDGVTYSRITHTLGDDEYWRIDGKHLVNSEGYVVHPGWDYDYTYTRQLPPFGTIDYASQDSYSGEVEGKKYVLYPFEGYFNPAEGESVPAGVGDVKTYMPGIGFVIKRSRYLSSAAYYEDRLIYHKLI